MYRPLAALGLAGMIVLACASLSQAQDMPECTAKDAVIADVLAKLPPGTHAEKVTGDTAKILTIDLLNNGSPVSGASYVLFYHDGAEFNVVIVAAFDEHNCMSGFVKGPKDRVINLLMGAGA